MKQLKPAQSELLDGMPSFDISPNGCANLSCGNRPPENEGLGASLPFLTANAADVFSSLQLKPHDSTPLRQLHARLAGASWLTRVLLTCSGHSPPRGDRNCMTWSLVVFCVFDSIGSIVDCCSCGQRRVQRMLKTVQLQRMYSLNCCR